MLAEKRAETILRELEVQRAVSVARLCALTGASEATVRRDLAALERRGRLSRVHGGAALPEEFRGGELDVETKRGLFREEKQAIARAAAALVEDEDVVFLDAGTTVAAMADYLQSQRALYVTNSIECAARLARRGLGSYVLGGAVKQGTVALIGAQALESLEKYSFTKAFLGANGVSLRAGFTTPDPEEAAVKALAAARAREVWMLVDESKFGKVTAAGVLPLDGAGIVTGTLQEPRYREYTRVLEAKEE